MGKGPLESSVENYLVDEAERRGGIALKGAVPGRRFLDRILILPGGATVYVECKRPIGGRYSVHQGETLERLQALGHRAVRVKTRAEVDALFAGLQTPSPQSHVMSAELAWKDGFIVGQANPGMNVQWLWMQRRDALKIHCPPPEPREAGSE